MYFYEKGERAMPKIKAQENGSVTIEATIALSAFMFAIVTVLTIVNIYIVQARISYAINQTAKEISQYSYLYALTGINEAHGNIVENGKQDTEAATQLLEDLNEVYNEIEGLASSGKSSDIDIASVGEQWENVKTGSEAIYNDIEDIAQDPKSVIFGVAKLAAGGAMDMAKSRLIAEPLSKALCKKHLVSTKDGDVEASLKFYGVVPTGTGSYYDALDFSNSSLFPNGSNEIIVNVVYDVKIIALLPIDFSFTFNQTAITHGWLAGSASYKSNAELKNENCWTNLTVTERANLIRHDKIDELMEEGYLKTKGLTDVPLYDPNGNQFAMIATMNPLYSGDGEPTKTLNDIDETALQNSIELLCGKIKSTTANLDTVTVQNGDDAQTMDCTGASNKIILVIPEDEGLREKIQSIIDKSNTNGVEIEIQTGYGNGAATTTTKNAQSQGEAE